MAAPTRVVANAAATITDLNQLIDLLEGATYDEAWLLKSTSGTDFKIRLADAAGAREFIIQDSAGTSVGTIDSDGNVAFNGTATITGASTLTGKVTTVAGLVLTGSATPTPTVEGEIWWDTDDDAIVVGDGASQAIFGKLTDTVPSANLGVTGVAGTAKQAARSTHVHPGPKTQDVNTAISADFVYTTNTTLTEDIGLVFTIAANEAWVVRYVLLVATSSTGGLKFQITGPAAPTTVGISFDYATSATAVSRQTATSLSSPLGASSGGAATTPCVIELYVRNGSTAGTIALATAQNSAAGTTTIKKESYMIATRVA